MTTEAGKQMLWWLCDFHQFVGVRRQNAEDAIAAIEAEAVAAERAWITEAVRELPCCSFKPGGRRVRHDDGCWSGARTAVLAIVNPEADR